jgi:fatty-acyl-CoA synthase
MAMQHVGATLIVMEKFDAATALDLIAKHRVTHGHFVPTMMVRLLKLPAEIRAKANLSSLKIILHGAGPCAPEVKYAMIDWVGPILEESYGGSEGNGMTIINSTEWLAHPGSVGRSFAGSLHILDDDGRELPIGETGLVYFSGGQAFEYHGNPELTKAAYRGAELSTLGDIGYLDAESYLFLTDRKNNMIVTGAVNVFPQEIEHVLIMDPDIVDVVVFGIPDVEMGEIIVAAVQPRSMDLAGGALATRLERLCRAQLAGYKTPRRFLFEHHLPRHETGKIYIGELKNKL